MQTLKRFLASLTAVVPARVRTVACIGLGFMSVCLESGAQNLVLSVRASSGAVTVSNTLTYTIDVTNQTLVALQNVFVTNTLPSSVNILSASAPQGTVIANGNQVTFAFVLLAFTQGAEMTLTVQPTQVGRITNSVVVTSTSVTNTAATNLVTQVVAPSADLSVAISGPAFPIFANDWMTYRVTVANLGPSAAHNVTLSNNLPAGVGLISLTPKNSVFTANKGVVLVSLGTLTNGASQNISFQVQPTNTGLLTFSASVSATDVADPNPTNNAAATNVTVNSFLPGLLIATNLSAMTYNPQTGLMDQTIRLSNAGTSSVASARVIVSGLTNWLYNAAGTNNGNPFVAYGAALDPGQSVDLALEYFVPTRLPITVPNSAYTPVAVPENRALPPAGTSFSITTVTNLAPGAVLIEFQAVRGRTYTILYSENSAFTNPLVAQPSIVAQADRVQWIDDGPPKTISSPINAASRFYRVILNQ